MDEKFEIKKLNKEIAKKIARVERMLQAFNLIDFFEELLEQVEKEFSISFVWVTLINKPKMTEIINTAVASASFIERVNIVDEKTFFDLTSKSVKPVLINNYIRPFYRLLPRNKKYLIRSLAIIPISLDNEIIGSLNLGDFSKDRYQPGMDTSLLKSFADSVSYRLSEIVAGEKQSDPQKSST